MIPSPTKFFPFAPNWKTGIDEYFGFPSWVLRAADASEQTGSQSGNVPRRGQTFEMILTIGQAQRFDNLLGVWQSRFFEVPHWPERSKLTTEAASGTATLDMPVAGRSFVPGGRLVLYRDWQTYELATIDTIVGDVVTLVDDLAATWPNGTRVFPVFYGAIKASMEAVRPTDTTVRASAMFDYEPSVTFGNTEDDGEALSYLDYELYLKKTNWVSGLTTGYSSDRLPLDKGTGKFDMYSTSKFSPHKTSRSWHITNYAERVALFAWLGRRLGMAVPFFMPTDTSDFTLVADPTSGNDYVDVKDNGYGEMLAAHPGRRDFIMLLRDGTYVAKRITSVTVLGGGSERLNFAGALAATIPRANVKRVSYLNLYRQVDEETHMMWKTDLVAICDVDFISMIT